jgi:hypothetical protein
MQLPSMTKEVFIPSALFPWGLGNVVCEVA